MRDALNAAILDKKARKALTRTHKREAKEAAARAAGKRIYVLGFKGDIRATAVRRLATEIDAVLTVARADLDEVVLRIESGGGTVTGYGLAAAQLMRLRERKIRVVASVDQVAASGGYLMACAADRIVAAPFALIGSIGVVAQLPNLHRLLKKNDIDFEEMTAGEFKRSVSMLGEITPAGREHFRGKLDDTHEAFKAFVQQCRPKLDIDQVANGDVWLGDEALRLGLVDALSTGDELLFRSRGEARLFEVATQERRNLLRQLFGGLGFATRLAWSGLANRLT
jgi:serine protease SohB